MDYLKETRDDMYILIELILQQREFYKNIILIWNPSNQIILCVSISLLIMLPGVGLKKIRSTNQINRKPQKELENEDLKWRWAALSMWHLDWNERGGVRKSCLLYTSLIWRQCYQDESWPHIDIATSVWKSDNSYGAT